MLVSTGIFSVVILVVVGAMLSLNQAQIKASNIQNIQDNVRFTLESMTKEMRVGSSFSAAQCSFPGCNEVTFLYKGTTIGYCQSGSVIRRFLPPVACAQGSPMTSDAVSINNMLFYLVDEAMGGPKQSRITIVVDGQSKNPTLRFETKFN